METNLIQGAARAELTRRGFLRACGAGAVWAGGAMALAGCSSKSSDAGTSSESSSASSSSTRTVTDMSDVEVTIPASVTKYCEDWYAHNEIDIMLDQAVGMTITNCSKKNFPWMYKVCPNMEKATYSEGEDPNFSEVVSLGSQVMFSQVNDLRSKCEEVGVPMINVMFKTFDEMQKSVSLTAEVLGDDAVEIANSYNKDLQAVLKDVESKTSGLADSDKPKVLTGNSVYKLDLDGTGTIISDWIKACGGVQVVTGDTTGKTTAEYSLEQIIDWNPDIIITDVPSQVDEILNDADWAAIAAVQKKQVYANPQGVFMWNRYGVEELLQLKWASKLFHPTLFTDVDMQTEVMDFYKTYLHYDLTADEADLILAAKDPDGNDHAVKGTD